MTDRQIINGYVIEEEIGISGACRIYRVYSSSLKQYMRLYTTERYHWDSGVTQIQQQFDTTMSLLQRLPHPHMIAIHEYWRQGANFYFVTPNIGNELCYDKRWKGGLSLVSVTRLVEQMTSALSLLHQHNIIHRDIQPCYIYWSDTDEYHLGGFEQIVFLPLNNLDSLISLITYMRPELIDSKEATFQSDIYCLGLVIWEALAGERPFASASPVGQLYKHVTKPLPIISTVSDAVNAVIQKATAKNPADRYADMQEFGAAFTEAAKLENT